MKIMGMCSRLNGEEVWRTETKNAVTAPYQAINEVKLSRQASATLSDNAVYVSQCCYLVD